MYLRNKKICVNLRVLHLRASAGSLPTRIRCVSTHYLQKTYLCISNTMHNKSKLIRVKILHTFIWLFFNLVLSYMLYAVASNKIDKWLWLGYTMILSEIITLLYFKFSCPITLIARRYSNSRKANFDIYLPCWLAKYNRLIYVSALLIVISMTLFRLKY